MAITKISGAADLLAPSTAAQPPSTSAAPPASGAVPRRSRSPQLEGLGRAPAPGTPSDGGVEIWGGISPLHSPSGALLGASWRSDAAVFGSDRFSASSLSNRGVPAPNPQAAPAAPTREMGGIWNKLRRKLAVREGALTIGPFGSIAELAPTTARAKATVTPANLHRPKANAATAQEIRGKVAGTAVMFAGKPSRAATACTLLAQPAEAHQAICAMFAAAQPHTDHLDAMFLRADAADLAHRLLVECALPDAGSTELRYVRPLQLGRVLAAVSGGDPQRAAAALTTLRAGGAGAATSGDAFHAARELARTPRGLATLMALAPAAGAAEPVAAEIGADAVLHSLRAANQLIAHWPAQTPAPQSLADVVGRAAQLAAAPGTPPSVALAANALLCAATLRADAGATPPPAQRQAYLAWRNGYTEAGPHSDLARTQARMFKLGTYAQRASASTPSSWLANAFGFRKSPLSALAFGTGGAELRHPDDDLRELHAIPDMAQHFQALAQSSDAGADALGHALRGAALQCWHQAIAQDGWQPGSRVDRGMRRQMVKQAAAQLGMTPAAVRASATYQAMRKAPLSAATLGDWVARLAPELRPAGHAEAIAKMKKFEPAAAAPRTADSLMSGLKGVVEQVRRTYDVRLSDGGVFGINGNLAASLAAAVGKLGVPVAMVAPEVKYLHGRHAIVNVGSSASSGSLFIGSDRRHASHVGASAIGGLVWHESLMLAGSVQALVYAHDSAAPRGVMTRMRFKTPGPAETNGMETWRAKLIDVLDTARPGQAGASPQTMWAELADKFYKDADLSINWLDTARASTVWSGVGISGGARAILDHYKVGPLAGAGATKVWRARTQRHETGGKQTLEQINHNSGSAVAASASLVAGLPPQGNFSGETGHIKSEVLPNAPLVGKACTMLQTQAGVTLRLTSEAGRLDPDLTFRDTEFLSAKKFVHYVDSRRPQWIAALGGAPEAAAAKLDEYLTQAKLDAVSGKQLFAERQWLTHPAAAALNHCDDAIEELGAGGHAGDSAQLAALQQKKAALLQADSSWDCRFLYTLESNSTQRTVGASFFAGAQRSTEMSHARQLSVLVADRPA
ncbi:MULTISPECIES: hypothetical protein [unclassified Duganella]|uniref:hypothetical protein n=1 Tax=unclassified Duganella TaxID=2636909 RepID=UPI000E34E07E|nr:MULTISPECIES: hypothetical protein [unclassified Duganella]RFP09330.1 hypothetical protein D0T23_26870 [Duganella sp. BJB475]RFP25366.1 hypothetical protein D0T21_27900 [Duganella sp. BJB476]